MTVQAQHDAVDTEERPASLFDSLKKLAASFVSHLHTRLALFATELAEEKMRLSSILFSALLAVFLFFMALTLVAVFIVAAGWDSPYRLYIIGGLFLAFLAGAAIAGGAVRSQIKSGPRPFEMSLAELYKDRHELERKDPVRAQLSEESNQ